MPISHHSVFQHGLGLLRTSATILIWQNLSTQYGRTLLRQKISLGWNSGNPQKLPIAALEGWAFFPVIARKRNRLNFSRLMEKDNKKARHDARKDYNDTVRVSVFDS